MAGSNDPLINSQWHLGLIGDIEAVWDEYSGQNVRIAIFDTGVDYTHVELDGNYNASLQVRDDVGNVLDGIDTGGRAHGTAIAGIIAAERNNLSGGTGIASSAMITGVNIFDPALFGYINGDVNDFSHVVHQAANFDIMSNSWGSSGQYLQFTSLVNQGLGTQLEAEFEFLSEYGRSGLGTNIFQAASNNNANANGSGFNATRFSSTIAATNQYGFANASSNHGSNILVAAPAATVTTDISGIEGYASGDYVSNFGGTSAATAVVSGVVALMLDANSYLGWRDINTILALSASLTGSDFGSGSGLNEEGYWFSNGAQNWNGGGHAFHANYGFGMIDAHGAVRLAEAWGAIYSQANTSANEIEVSAHSGQIDLATINNGSVEDSLLISSNLTIENISVTIDFDFSFYKYFYSPIIITLIAPDNTRFILAENDVGFDARNGLQWEYGVTAALGMSSRGEWTLEITDTNGNSDVGSLNSWSIEFFGGQASANDVYTFTDDFVTLAGSEASRTVIRENDGGTDWLNLAAVTSDMKVDLKNGVVAEVSGQEWSALQGSIENIITGDGNDRLFGNDSGNVLMGGRGNDYLFGYAGDDTLNGGQGIDHVYGGAGNDVIYVDTPQELAFITGGAGFDTLILQGFSLPLDFDLAAAGFEDFQVYSTRCEFVFS